MAPFKLAALRPSPPPEAPAPAPPQERPPPLIPDCIDAETSANTSILEGEEREEREEWEEDYDDEDVDIEEC